VAVLAVAGVILCAAWRSLITSFGQLNRGKFQVINTIELYLKAAIYAAEWEALGRGENPKIYRWLFLPNASKRSNWTSAYGGKGSRFSNPM
jgi:hypothetical protein